MFDIINTLAFNVIKMLQFTHSLYYSVFHVYYSILAHILQYLFDIFFILVRFFGQYIKRVLTAVITWYIIGLSNIRFISHRRSTYDGRRKEIANIGGNFEDPLRNPRNP